MSDTPRTDAVKYHARGQFQDVVAADFARKIERELADAKAEGARLRRCVQHLINNGYTAGHCGKTPDELCDELLPDEWPSCIPLPP